MPEVKYVCPECGGEADAPGMCAACGATLVATCAECGNPVVGEHVHEEWPSVKPEAGGEGNG